MVVETFVEKLEREIEAKKSLIRAHNAFEELIGVKCSVTRHSGKTWYSICCEDSTVSTLKSILKNTTKVYERRDVRKLPRKEHRMDITVGDILGKRIEFYTTIGPISMQLGCTVRELYKELNTKTKNYWEKKEFVGDFAKEDYMGGGSALFPTREFKDGTIIKLLSPLLTKD